MFTITQETIDKFKAEREALKESNPTLYALTGGDKASSYTVRNLSAGKTVTKVADTAVSAASNAFDLFVWLRDNWQLAIVGALSLLLLIKRL